MSAPTRLLAKWSQPAPSALLKSRADARKLTYASLLTYPTFDLAGDYVEPSGCDFSTHKLDPSIDFEHARDPLVKGLPVAWARESLDEPGAPYAVEMVPLDFAEPGQPPQVHTVPVGTEFFDPRSRVSMQVFGLREGGACPASSLEFRPVRGFYKALGPSPLEPRRAYWFGRIDAIRWTVCAQGVNPGALGITKAMPQVHPSEPMLRVLRDKRVNVGGTYEPLLPVLHKALSEAAAAQQAFQGSYDRDTCPECGGKAEGACRCIRNDRFCANGHTWERLKSGLPALLEGPHGKVTKAYGGMTLAQAEADRKSLTDRFRKPTAEKAMPPKPPQDDEYDDASEMAGAEVTPELENDVPVDPEMGEDEAPALGGVSAKYQFVQDLTDACDRYDEAMRSSDSPELRKAAQKFRDMAMALAQKVQDTANKHDAKLNGTDTGDAESEGDEDETPDDDTDAESGGESHAEPDGDEDGKGPPDDDGDEPRPVKKGADGIITGIRAVYKSVIRRFKYSDIQKAKEQAAAPPPEPEESAEYKAALAEFRKWERYAGGN